MIRVVIEHRAKDEEHAEYLVEAIKETRDEARKQPGFITGETLVDTEDPRHVLVISTWKSEKEWNKWDKSPIRMILRNQIEKHLEGPYTVVTLNADIIWNENIQHVF